MRNFITSLWKKIWPSNDKSTKQDDSTLSPELLVKKEILQNAHQKFLEAKNQFSVTYKQLERLSHQLSRKLPPKALDIIIELIHDQAKYDVALKHVLGDKDLTLKEFLLNSDDAKKILKLSQTMSQDLNWGFELEPYGWHCPGSYGVSGEFGRQVKDLQIKVTKRFEDKFNSDVTPDNLLKIVTEGINLYVIRQSRIDALDEDTKKIIDSIDLLAENCILLEKNYKQALKEWEHAEESYNNEVNTISKSQSQESLDFVLPTEEHHNEEPTESAMGQGAVTEEETNTGL